ncbi:DNA-binding protein [Pseudomonas sp. ICMP22404]|uniref:helix-turn-helix domain-containing transcriptional regulator n=1 Tax=Pseudomonas sp. ICMP22404 TaxID=2583807 RepID=UPI00211E0580|nr:hypothetical protein [Pseudomonas sp. ICMP22404]
MALTRNYKHTIVERTRRDPEFAQLLLEEAPSMTGTFTRFDAAIYLKTPEEMTPYLDACFDEDDGDGVLVRAALDDIARAKDMTPIALDADGDQLNVD